MFWSCWRIFGWEFTLKNWLLGKFWRWYFRNEKEEYLQDMKDQVRQMVQRWYLMEKEEQRDENLLVVGVLSAWVMFRAYPEDREVLLGLIHAQIKQRVIWLESGL